MSRVLAATILTLTVALAPLAARAGAYDDFQALTSAEKWLVLRYFWQVGKVQDAAEFAKDRSAATYPALPGSDDQRDALRHSTWNGCMTAALDSKDAAKRWADAHEEIPSNPASRKAMDLSNNHTGREIVWSRRTVSGPWWNRKSTLPSRDATLALMKTAVETGGLVMIEVVNGARDPHNGRRVPTTRP